MPNYECLACHFIFVRQKTAANCMRCSSNQIMTTAKSPPRPMKQFTWVDSSPASVPSTGGGQKRSNAQITGGGNQPTTPAKKAVPLVFYNCSVSQVANTAMLNSAGQLDDSTLPMGLIVPRFEYVATSQPAGSSNAPLPKLGANDLVSFSNQSPRQLDPQNSQLLNSYQGGKGGMTASQKAAFDPSGRLLHHDVNGRLKAQRHFNDLSNNLIPGATDQNVTETGGEAMAALYMLNSRPDYEMKYGFKKGTGIDQIWVRRAANGDITEYLIVEAKGYGVSGKEAGLGSTADKGFQMSARWVYLSLLELAATTTNSQFNQMGRKMVETFEKSSNVLIWGICLTEQADRSKVKVMDCGVYNRFSPASISNVLNEWKAPALLPLAI